MPRSFSSVIKHLEYTLSFLEEVSEYIYRENYRQYIAVNVKLYGKYQHPYSWIAPYVKELCSKYNISSTSEAEKYFSDDNNLNDIWNDWIDSEREYAIEVLKGVRNSSAKYWDSVAKEIREGKKISFPAINELTTRKERLKKVKEFADKDSKELFYCSLLNKDDFAFLGRQGGNFVICPATIVDRIDDIKEYIASLQSKQPNLIEDAYYFSVTWRERAEAVLWAIKTISEMKEGLDFRDEIENSFVNLFVDINENIHLNP